uniref:T-cell surface glycoprotein CD8beta n=1 Tax=Dicentrarchus labrax TaxID=13489 RepID=E6ZG09_DICLA|nr:T-cell surface glycoprotein CD8beta [Dicentrarchus labrax]
MIPLPAWMLLIVLLRTGSGSEVILQEEMAVMLYPEILSIVTIDCYCGTFQCDTVYWFHSVPDKSKVQFLGKCNNAGRSSYEKDVDQARFVFEKKGQTNFVLRIRNVTEKDRGMYSCVLKDRKMAEMWKLGTFLQPGVIPPTLPPKTEPKRPKIPVCRCPKKNTSQDDCGSLILWPSVGFIAALALALICTLYYFSSE